MKIKGHTEIQLTNVKTGEVKTYHDDNMMTNGLAEFMKNHGMLCGTPFTNDVKNDMVNTLLGGILLFDTALTESANNTRLTDGVKMVANACHGVTHTGDPTELGSYDSNESGWQNADHTVYRHVFTWTTSQGNGTIASVCLTSKPHGYVGEGNITSKARATNSNFTPLTYSASEDINNSKNVLMIKDNYAYFIALDTTDDTIKITRVHVTDTECDMRDVKTITNAVEEDIVTITNPTSTPITSLNRISCRVLTSSVVFAFRDSSHSRILVFTLPSNMASLTSYVEVTQSATSLTFGDTAFLNSDASKIIVSNSNNTSYYTVALDNLANVSEITKEGTVGGASLVYSSGKRHLLYNCVYDEALNKLIPLNCDLGGYQYMTQDALKDDKSAFATNVASNTSNHVHFGRRNDYLATINNLSSAVTKDSTQTMKVIYTLTFTA